ncbi:MAG TPA: peptidylprolyl isomerase [Acidimicrobiales bacterium]
MPSDKRARQRAGREARLAAANKVARRRRLVRNGIGAVVVVAVVAGSVYLINRHGSPKPTPATPATEQAAADKVAVAAGCPKSTATRVNTQSYASAPPMTIDVSKSYAAKVKTTVGTFTIALDPASAPKSVNNFVFLAGKGFYHCVIFHRVIPGFMDQTGDPTGTGTGSPGYEYSEPGPATASPQYPIGSVAMANSNNPATTDPTTNGSQFFIVTGSQGESLPPDYTLFGKVTSGMSVVQKINKEGNSSASANGVPPKVTQRILSVSVTES